MRRLVARRRRIVVVWSLLQSHKIAAGVCRMCQKCTWSQRSVDALSHYDCERRSMRAFAKPTSPEVGGRAEFEFARASGARDFLISFVEHNAPHSQAHVLRRDAHVTRTRTFENVYNESHFGAYASTSCLRGSFFSTLVTLRNEYTVNLRMRHLACVCAAALTCRTVA